MNARTEFVIEPGRPTILIRRLLDAPRKLVFAAVTRPEYVAQWWGFRVSTMVECKADLRVGGAWRYVVRLPDGSQHGFGGVYQEIVPPERLVQTFRYDGYPEAESVETVVLQERGDQTLLTVTVLHASVENRDGHVASGMEAGCSESHDRLAELLVRLQQAGGGRQAGAR